jgi:hypothetical protein
MKGESMWEMLAEDVAGFEIWAYPQAYLQADGLTHHTFIGIVRERKSRVCDNIVVFRPDAGITFLNRSDALQGCLASGERAIAETVRRIHQR